MKLLRLDILLAAVKEGDLGSASEGDKESLGILLSLRGLAFSGLKLKLLQAPLPDSFG